MKKLLLLLLLLLAPPAEATDRYVKGSCTNAITTYAPVANTCTGGSSPVYSTINNGVAAMSAGDRLYLRSATYTENLNCNVTCPPSGSDDSHRTIIAVYSGDSVIWQSATGASIVNMVSVSYVTITGQGATLEFDGTGMGGSGGTDNGDAGISTNANTSHLTFSYLKVHNVRTSLCASGTAAPGILLGGNFHVVDHVESYDNGHTPCGGEVDSGYGVYAPGADSIVQDSIFHDNGGSGIQQYKQSGGSDRNTLRRNTIYENCQLSIQVCMGIISAGDFNLVYTNLIWSTVNKNNLIGIKIYGGSTNAGVYNNTIVGFQYFGLTTAEGAGADNTTARNNIIHGSGSNGAQIQVSGSGSVASNSLCTTTCEVGTSNHAEAASVTFVNPAAHNYNIKAGSAAIGTGVNLSAIFTADIAGVTWNVPFGLSAFQIVTPGTPLVTKLPSSPTALRLGSATSFKIGQTQ